MAYHAVSVFIGNKSTEELSILVLQDLKQPVIALHDHLSCLLQFSADLFWEPERWKSTDLMSYRVHQSQLHIAFPPRDHFLTTYIYTAVHFKV